MDNEQKLPSKDELIEEVFSFIQPAENWNTPCESDGYNEHEVFQAVRKVLLKYKYGITENKQQ